MNSALPASEVGQIESQRSGEPPVPASQPKRTRSAWVDIAKMVSITLVVAWHVFEFDLYLNKQLLFLRMPLFFMVAGFFAKRSLSKPFVEIFRDKVANFLYLYLLWNGIRYVIVIIPRSLMAGDLVTPFEYLQDMVENVMSYWFFLGLAFMFFFARLLVKVNVRLLLLCLLGLYAFSVLDGNWEPVTFGTRMARLSVMFLLGALLYDRLNALSRRFRNFWPISLGLFFLVSSVIWELNLQWLAPSTLLAGAVGILAVAQFSQAVDGTWLGRGMSFVGSRTIYIYALHTIFMLYLYNVLSALGMDAGLGRKVVTFLILIPLSLCVGLILQRFTPWLFEAPWVGRRREALVPAAA